VEKEIRVLVCRVGKQPVVETVVNALKTWQSLVKGPNESSGTIDIVYLYAGVEMIVNDNGRYECVFNRKVPGRAPSIPPDATFVIRPPNAAPPGALGYHEVYGDFVLSRTDEDGYQASLTDKDIEMWMRVLRLDEKLAG
jgi:hypothetical protein